MKNKHLSKIVQSSRGFQTHSLYHVSNQLLFTWAVTVTLKALFFLPLCYHRNTTTKIFSGLHAVDGFITIKYLPLVDILMNSWLNFIGWRRCLHRSDTGVKLNAFITLKNMYLYKITTQPNVCWFLAKLFGYFLAVFICGTSKL